jgi:lactoylglutathione lyase
MATRSMPNIFTRGIEAALVFYRDQLGFTTVYQVPAVGQPEHVVLSRGDSQLALSTDRAIAAVRLEPSSGNAFELIVWYDDVDAEAARLGAAGAPVLVEPYQHAAGHRRAYVADPDGNWLALVDAR